MIEALFWSALAFVGYTYAGYPAIVWLLACARHRPAADPEPVTEWPTVCVIVPVFNEQNRVAKKIANLRQLDYPRERLRILFVSDGSTDATAARISAEQQVELVAYGARRGKPYALNIAVRATDAEILVFTDARQEVAKESVRNLVSRLLTPGIGAVSGELVHVDAVTREAAHIGLYWRYEKFIRRAESRFASTLGVTGALYAIRRADYVPLAEDALLDDFEVPMAILKRGKRVVLEGRAVVFDELQETSSGERRRKVRTLTGNFQAFARHRWLFSPLRNPVFFQFLSHKVFRLFVPYALALMFVASVLASGNLYRAAALLQLALYLGVAAGLLLPHLREQRVFSFLVVFFELNWAAVVALKNFLAGRIDAKWEKT